MIPRICQHLLVRIVCFLITLTSFLLVLRYGNMAVEMACHYAVQNWDLTTNTSQQQMLPDHLPDNECFLIKNASWQQMLLDNKCFLTTNASWQRMFPDNGCFLTTDVSWQRMFPDNGCFLAENVFVLFTLSKEMCNVRFLVVVKAFLVMLQTWWNTSLSFLKHYICFFLTSCRHMLHTLPDRWHITFAFSWHVAYASWHNIYFFLTCNIRFPTLHLLFPDMLHTLPDMEHTFTCASSDFPQSMFSHVVLLTPLFFSLGPNMSAGSSLTINSPSSISLVATQPTPRPANNSSLYMSDVCFRWW